MSRYILRPHFIGPLAVLILISLPVSSRCQDATPQGDATKDQAPKAAGSSNPFIPGTPDEQGQDAGVPQPGPGMPIDTQRRVLGKAAPYAGLISPLRFGNFSIDGLDSLYIHDNFKPIDSTPSTNLNLGLIRTTFAFNKAFRKFSINLQYAPQVTFVNGQTNTSGAANNNLDFGTTFDISPRLTLALRNQFIQAQFRQVFSDQLLEVYRGVDGILPGDFLENNGSFMEENVSAVINYKLTPRWTFTMQPMFRYLDTTNKTLNFNGTGTDVRNAAAFTYALSPHTNVGIVSNFEAGHTIKPLSSDNYFTGFGGFYSQQLAKTLFIQGQIGTEVAFYDGDPNRPWLLTGAFSVVKNLSTTALAVSYLRENQLVNYLGNRLDERVDVTYGVPLTRVLVLRSGAGYFHEVGPEPHTQGKYAQSSMDLKLPYSLVLTANYTYRFQHASVLDLISGTHSTFSFGLRWVPKLVGMF